MYSTDKEEWAEGASSSYQPSSETALISCSDVSGDNPREENMFTQPGYLAFDTTKRYGEKPRPNNGIENWHELYFGSGKEVRLERHGDVVKFDTLFAKAEFPYSVDVKVEKEKLIRKVLGHETN